MNILQLLEWQWKRYPIYHRSRTNLLIHIVAVPVFLFGNVMFALALLKFAWLWVLGWGFLMLGSLGLQAYGHRREIEQSVPFSGFGNAFERIFLEQWINFPRFFFSGSWLRAFRQRVV